MSTRYKLSRERAGLSLAQTTKMVGFDVHSIEAGSLGPSDGEIKVLADVYQVTECWLRGHDPDLDVSAVAARAENAGVSFNDFSEIATMGQSQSLCQACRVAAGGSAKPPVFQAIMCAPRRGGAS